MSHYPLELIELIHESLSIVFRFMLSEKETNRVMEKYFQGSFKKLNEIVHDRAEKRAIKALIELAFFLRTLDDEKQLSDKEWAKATSVGVLEKKGNTTEDLRVRDVANKIIHAIRFEWLTDDPNSGGVDWGPIIVCYPREPDKWIRAHIKLTALSAICGEIITESEDLVMPNVANVLTLTTNFNERNQNGPVRS